MLAYNNQRKMTKTITMNLLWTPIFAHNSPYMKRSDLPKYSTRNPIGELISLCYNNQLWNFVIVVCFWVFEKGTKLWELVFVLENAQSAKLAGVSIHILIC